VLFSYTIIMVPLFLYTLTILLLLLLLCICICTSPCCVPAAHSLHWAAAQLNTAPSRIPEEAAWCVLLAAPGREEAHPSLRYPILQVARNSAGAMVAMGKGNSGHNQKPVRTLSLPPCCIVCPLRVAAVNE
jgi:hypothetical protein